VSINSGLLCEEEAPGYAGLLTPKGFAAQPLWHNHERAALTFFALLPDADLLAAAFLGGGFAPPFFGFLMVNNATRQTNLPVCALAGAWLAVLKSVLFSEKDRGVIRC
jgi:hypothetical protein